MKYFALLTKLGENLLAQATALGTKLELTHMAVGDGGGKLPTPDTNQTKLIAEKRRAAINTLFIDEKNPNQIIAEQIIPEQDGGWWIREIGLFDKTGNLIAVANCPETHKPQLAEGSGRTQVIRMVLAVSHTDSVTLKIDPSVVLATREYVNKELQKKVDINPHALTGDVDEFGNASINAANRALRIYREADGTVTIYSREEATPTSPYLVRFRLPIKQGTAAMLGDVNLLDLKKIDKSSITHQLGNSTSLVVSQHLLSIEVGKLQPKGDFVTTSTFNSKLNEKMGVTGAQQLKGSLTISDTGSAVLKLVCDEDNSNYITFYNKGIPSISNRTAYIGYGESNTENFNIVNYKVGRTVTINANGLSVSGKGMVMHTGDNGFGRNRPDVLLDADFRNALVSQIFIQGGGANDNAFASWGAGLVLPYDKDRIFGIFARSASGALCNFVSENGEIKRYDIYNSANTNLDHNGCVRANNTNALSDYPVGSPIPWTQAAVPVGYLALNGQSFNKATYPLLAKAYPSGVLDDMRAEFIRGLDAGRGIDSGRTILSKQGDATRNIKGAIFARAARTTGANTFSSSGAFVDAEASWEADSIDISTTKQTMKGSELDISRVVPTANENRPRNVAFLYIVRAA
ncbi:MULTISPECIES: phage tail protein [Providencia]|uniref:phage tail-collar fiber domain-containing protein n=1 Tax=Providencia TaxID=586 RepID=UPI001419C276|nr:MULTISPECIES: phage tail protein [Providencia]NIA43827.1 hypothetical protein [Providencia rettgeri]NIA97656.1 hypothetical protein [Providencia rettgeri]NIB15231.1 hypothetical protein [Providencia rettgeri]NIB35443.1 hypothetical protein [Providencia rettgeri]NIL71386.1 hypothetical protein [Providencia sp. 504mA]